jgi:hypothetical protein
MFLTTSNIILDMEWFKKQFSMAWYITLKWEITFITSVALQSLKFSFTPNSKMDNLASK